MMGKWLCYGWDWRALSTPGPVWQFHIRHPSLRLHMHRKAPRKAPLVLPCILSDVVEGRGREYLWILTAKLKIQRGTETPFFSLAVGRREWRKWWCVGMVWGPRTRGLAHKYSSLVWLIFVSSCQALCLAFHMIQRCLLMNKVIMSE